MYDYGRYIIIIFLEDNDSGCQYGSLGNENPNEYQTDNPLRSGRIRFIPFSSTFLLLFLILFCAFLEFFLESFYFFSELISDCL
jgi:Ni,Fe-hydrogenase I cytochrome b subunit